MMTEMVTTKLITNKNPSLMQPHIHRSPSATRAIWDQSLPATPWISCAPVAD
jgi:hypothetical protein